MIKYTIYTVYEELLSQEGIEKRLIFSFDNEDNAQELMHFLSLRDHMNSVIKMEKHEVTA